MSKVVQSACVSRRPYASEAKQLSAADSAHLKLEAAAEAVVQEAHHVVHGRDDLLEQHEADDCRAVPKAKGGVDGRRVPHHREYPKLQERDQLRAGEPHRPWHNRTSEIE
eukprot:5625068-Pyramimonas_sp.AAC.1